MAIPDNFWLRTIPNILNSSPGVPKYLIHFVTNRCNARCHHCFIDFDINTSNNRYKDNTKDNELSLDEIHRFTSSFKGQLNHVNLTGGEVFLRDDISEIVSSYVENGGISSASILTNGYYTDKVINTVENILVGHPKLKLQVDISLDDIGEAHDKHRELKNLFTNTSKTINCLKKIKSKQLTPSINLTATEENHHKLDEIYDQIMGMFGDINVNCGLVRGFNTSKEHIENYRRFSHRRVDNNLQFFRNSKGIKGRFDLLYLLGVRNKLVISETISVVNGGKFKSTCVAGKVAAVLYGNGEVYPCEILEKPLGNIRDFDYDISSVLKTKQTQECNDFIKKTCCSCDHGCFIGATMTYSPKYYPALAKEWVNNFF